MKLFDTIAAISTPQGKGGVAMIRISGMDALDVADKIFKRVNKTPLSQADNAKMVRGIIVDPNTLEEIDDGMAVVFRAPASFTGENTVEIYCHGGILVTRKVLAAALLGGARAAEAGEFTRRAFVSGKMGLSEAEALGALLEAKSNSQLKLSRSGMKGTLTKRTTAIYQNLVSVLTGIYAALDFPDEDLNEYSRNEIAELVSAALDDISALAATYGTGRAVAEGIPTVICGKANAGKSSVYNRIIGYDAAIVTDIEGTTRDVLTQTAILGDTTLLLSDTAGIRQTDDKVETIGIERALAELDAAELVLCVFDGAAALDDDDRALIERIINSKKACIALLNKNDLTPNADTVSTVSNYFPNCISVCASSGKGFDALADTTNKFFIDGSIDMSNDAVVTGARQFAALSAAADALKTSLTELKSEAPLDLCCIGIEAATSAIGEVDGRELGEEIVSEIFSKFCVGK